MRLEARKYLHDIEQAANLIAQFTAGRGFDDYAGDAMLRAAVEREFENFGLLYGMGAPRLREQAANDYGVVLTADEAADFRDKFFRTYSGLRAWHRRHGNGLLDTRTLAGRRRRRVSRFTEQLNTPVQGSGADGLKAALGLLWETRDRCPDALPVLCVHDEIVVECDVARAEEATAWLADSMTRGMAELLTKVPVVVETKIARDWSGTPL